VLLLLQLLAGTGAAACGLPEQAACVAAAAKGEQSAVAGSSSEVAPLLLMAPLSLAKRLVPRLLPLSMSEGYTKDAAGAPAASAAVGDVGRVTIGEEMGVSMYSLPDMSSANLTLLC
jgi:hypothetical protein